jgi:Ca-activated chloride channel family protein
MLAAQLRTSLVLGIAGAAVLAAVLLHPRTNRVATPVGDDGMRVSGRLTTSKILAGAMDHNLAVTITAPNGAQAVRPPLSLSIVIDRSGSMNGEPMQNAKAAAARLVAQLDPSDAFAIVTYSSSDETVTPMVRATDANKARAMDAIARIYDDGGTCISCGVLRGAAELAQTPVIEGVRRIVLISDGQANEGIWDRGELAQLAARTAASGVSISSVGVGLDFDEVTMVRLAEVGRGNYYFVEDTRHLDAMFARELGGLADTIATDVRLVLIERPGVRIEEAYGYPLTRAGDHVIVPVADLRAGETRKVVLRVHVAAAKTGAANVADVQLGWRRVIDGVHRKASASVRVDVVDDAGAVAASADPAAVLAVEQALSARALEEATLVYETQGADAARMVLQKRVDAVRANKYLAPKAGESIETVIDGASAGFAAEPPSSAGGMRVRKQNRASAFDLAR